MNIFKKIVLFGLPVAALLLGTGVQAGTEDEPQGGGLMPIKVSPYKKRPPVNAGTIAEGKRIYDDSCVYCHGVNGDGKGPVAYFLSRDTAPHPRDLTSGIYKFRSTASGELPMDEDLFRTVSQGIPGFMPSFIGLDTEDRWKVVYYIKTLNEDFEGAEPPELVKVVGGPIPSTAGSIRAGYKVYQNFKCWECHGGGGRGDGTKAPDLKDDWDFLLPPRNLTMRNSFKNGKRPEDLYRTIMA
ncbi:MAG TPA: c-type cytochrome, partial [Gammaproteobacteria bacterium]|nr:c-type cytochrome [Gammaproteobacteria bacterium]